MGGGSGSKGTAINSVKNAKMKRVGAGWGRIQLAIGGQRRYQKKGCEYIKL